MRYIIAKRDGDRDVYWTGFGGWQADIALAKRYRTRADVNKSAIWNGSSRYAAHVCSVKA